MKIEKLNENKIKITFNIDDLSNKNIDLYSFMHNTPETQDLFWEVLNKAEKEYGFNVDNSMIYVEATTSGSGNFILFVTKTNENPSVSNVNLLNNSLKNKNIRLKKKLSNNANSSYVYEFDSFDNVCEFSKTINTNAIIQSSLYSLNDKYYLKASNMPFHNILEYARPTKISERFDAKLNEYGTEIIKENALSIINKFFNKKRRKC